jgi:CBS domain containing-hemolysin-like protein
MAIFLSFIIIAILILLNGLFVSAEFSIIGVRPSRIEQLASQGSGSARWLRQILNSRRRTDRYIATAQLGITLASLGLGMYAEPAIAHLIEGPLHDWFGLEGAIVHTISFIFALAIITYLHVVIGEMIPKSLALQHAERTVMVLVAPMRLISRLLSVPVTVLNRIGLLALKLFRVAPPAADSRLYSLDELELVVLESYSGGLLAERQQELVANILDFTEQHVEEVMTPRTLMTAIPVDITEEELLDRMSNSRYSRLPVYGRGRDDILGILHLKDLVRQQLTGQAFDLRALIRRVAFVPETLPVKTLLARFKRQRQQMAIVIDEHGGTLGLVTMEDLLEEVVGEVRDEFDVGEEEPLTPIGPGLIQAAGTAQLEDLARLVPLAAQGYDVRTVGGFVLAELGRRPQVGDEVSVGNTTFRVLAVRGLTILRVSVQFPEEPGSPADSGGEAA